MTIQTPFNLDDLVAFIIRARNHGYAGSAEKIKNPQRPGFKEFRPYAEGDFEYVDSYSGHYFAPGQEVVRSKGIPVWNMAYNGGMLPQFHGNLEFAKQTFDFLKQALARVDHTRPFRGPNCFVLSPFIYIDNSEGDISNFKGTERIYWSLREVFRQDYIGGLIIHK